MSFPSLSRPETLEIPQESKQIGSAVVETKTSSGQANTGTTGFDFTEDAVFAQVPATADYGSVYQLGVPGGILGPVAIEFDAKFVGDFSDTFSNVGVGDDADNNRIAFTIDQGSHKRQTQDSGNFDALTLSGQDWSTWTTFRFEWSDEGNDGDLDLVRFFVDGDQIAHSQNTPTVRMHPRIQVFNKGGSSPASECTVYMREMRVWRGEW